MFLAVTQRQLGLMSGVLVAVPIPDEFSIDADETNEAIEQAVSRARSVSGMRSIHCRRSEPCINVY